MLLRNGIKFFDLMYRFNNRSTLVLIPLTDFMSYSEIQLIVRMKSKRILTKSMKNQPNKQKINPPGDQMEIICRPKILS